MNTEIYTQYKFKRESRTFHLGLSIIDQPEIIHGQKKAENENKRRNLEVIYVFIELTSCKIK